ncbi:hypothetical protein GGE09_001008 [Roseobacter sp. N2S]|nr:hypothetical protein [Roseobacter sp. N2S]
MNKTIPQNGRQSAAKTYVGKHVCLYVEALRYE